MSRITWDAIDARRYEAGVDRGVLYPMDSVGVPWSGLLAVEETYDGGELTSYAEDGNTYLAIVSPKDYTSKLRAFSAPKEFGPCVGDLEVKPGFILTRQKRSLFNFSYRTGISDLGYKIHIVYNVLATPTSRSYATTNDTPDAVNLEWELAAVPLSSDAYRPTAHFIVDTTKFTPYSISVLEDHLYGTDTTDPQLPMPNDTMTDLLSVEPDVGIVGTILEPIGGLI
jgi:hypothetical protein